MSLFERFAFKLPAAEAELTSFKAWFAGVTFVKESVIVGEIRRRPHMTCLLGPTGLIAAPNLMRWEVGLGGLYRADLVIGNDERREFTLIEFEGASQTSIFGKTRTNQSRASHNQRDASLRDNFGGDIRKSTYLLICGRNTGISTQSERERFDYRRHYVSVQAVPAQVLTYDEMVLAMTDNLEIWKT